MIDQVHDLQLLISVRTAAETTQEGRQFAVEMASRLLNVMASNARAGYEPERDNPFQDQYAGMAIANPDGTAANVLDVVYGYRFRQPDPEKIHDGRNCMVVGDRPEDSRVFTLFFYDSEMRPIKFRCFFDREEALRVARNIDTADDTGED